MELVRIDWLPIGTMADRAEGVSEGVTIDSAHLKHNMTFSLRKSYSAADVTLFGWGIRIIAHTRDRRRLKLWVRKSKPTTTTTWASITR